MKFSALLPVLLACSNALLIPGLSKDEVEAVPKRAVEEEFPESFELTARDSNSTSGDDDIFPKSYIVVLKKGFEAEDYQAHGEWVASEFSALRKRGELEHFPNVTSDSVEFFNVSSFNGYQAYLPPALLDSIKEDPLVDFVEADSIVHAYGFQTQKNAPWGLARVSQRQVSGQAPTKYLYDDQGGNGVTAYVVDTGIKVSHPDFEGRAVWGQAIASPQVEEDGNGHGSHVAGTIGGKTYGIAKKVNLVAISVLNAKGKGYNSDIIKGIEFAVNDHQAKVSAKQKGYKGATLNLSLGGSASRVIDQAVNAAVSAGVHVVVAAGNENQNACNVSPARASGPITVGASDIDDQRADFSNYGRCVDIQAPGVDILSVGINSDTRVLSGTSMATPHVVGLLSYFLSLQPGLDSEFSGASLITPPDLKRKFIAYGTRNVIGGLDYASPNILAYNGAGGDISDFWAK
ncbi:hypothetical protein JCM33374_g1405 [Metschnikowia sp. JCM 33374]|nr:hypothetical protein JCM33374_g1405 [Metschnikowia sp. JCM 33374]